MSFNHLQFVILKIVGTKSQKLYKSYYVCQVLEGHFVLLKRYSLTITDMVFWHISWHDDFRQITLIKTTYYAMLYVLIGYIFELVHEKNKTILRVYVIVFESLYLRRSPQQIYPSDFLAYVLLFPKVLFIFANRCLYENLPVILILTAPDRSILVATIELLCE